MTSERDEERQSILERAENRYKWLPMWMVIFQIVGIVSFVMAGVWIGVWLGGVGWDGTGAEFNVHTILMMLGMVYLNANALLTFRILRNRSYFVLKIVHCTLQGLSCLFIIVGLLAVFQYHNEQGINNLYSVHSWIGICIVIIFFSQFTLGAITYLVPAIPPWFRNGLLPYHVYIGMALFVAATINSIVGIQEKLSFVNNITYVNAESAVANCLGLLIGITGIIVMYPVTRETWKWKAPRVPAKRTLPRQQ